NSFSVAERMEILDALVEAGVPPARLLVGTGCCALPDTLMLTRHAAAHGVGGVLMLPPFYYKNLTDEGLFAAFDRVIQQVGDGRLQVFLYHFPTMSGVPFSHAVVERLLAAYPRTVAGMKDSSGDRAHMKAAVEAFPGFRVFAGTEQYLLDILRMGGAGCITATTNVTCRWAGKIVARRHTEDVRALQRRLTAVRRAIEAYPMIPALKQIMAERTHRMEWLNLRPPLTRLREPEAAALRDRLAQLRFFLEMAD
ncbi:MAG: dihydrodipicolinate synthase family protein, partial [Rhodothermales bacterium]